MNLLDWMMLPCTLGGAWLCPWTPGQIGFGFLAGIVFTILVADALDRHA